PVRRPAAAGRNRLRPHHPPTGAGARRAHVGARADPCRGGSGRPCGRACDPVGGGEVLAAVPRLVYDLAVTVVMAEHRVERVLQYADSVVHVGDGRVGVGSPADVMTHSTIAPPVVQLRRWAGWSPLPMSVRDAYRRAGDLRDSLADAPTQLV